MEGSGMNVTQQLSKEIVNTKFEDLPTKVVERIKRGILDNVGITFLGYPNIGKEHVDYAKLIGVGAPESTIAGDGTKASSMAAAGANASIARGTDFFDVGSSKPNLCVLVPCGVAIGERVGASGKDLTTAVALAYEISSRYHRAAYPLGMITHDIPDRDTSLPGNRWHDAASMAIVTAKLLGLDEAQVSTAIGIAWYLTPLPMPIEHHRQSGETSAYSPATCHWGIQAALMAQNGFEGPSDVVGSHYPYDDVDKLVSSPSPFHYVSNEIHIKPWISSRGLQPGIHATLDILNEEKIRPGDIDEIRFSAKSLYLDHPYNSPEPKNYWEATYSIPWAFTMAILGYNPGPEWLSEERLKDSEALALAHKVKVAELPLATRIWNSGITITNEGPNEVEVTARGKVFKKRRTYGETLGSSLNPMPDEMLDRKFKANVTPILGEEQTAELAAMLWRLEDQNDVRNLTRLYKRRD